MDAAITHFKNACGKFVNEVTVVRDEDNSPSEPLKRGEQYIFGAHIKMVGGLIEQQEIRRLQQHAGERITVALSTAEYTKGLEDIVATEDETTKQSAQLGLCGMWSNQLKVIKHTSAAIKFFVLVLGEVVSFHIMADFEFPCGR